MNDTIRLLLAHRSIRRYAPQPVPLDHVRAAVAAGQAASTSSALQGCSVLRVTDPAARARLADLCGPQEKVATAGAFLVVLGDTRRHRLACAAAGTPYHAGLEAFLVAAIDASLFAQNMAVAFESMGYGICYVGGLRNRLDEVDRILGLPEGLYPFFGLCVGLPAEDPPARPRLPLDAVLFDDRYPGDDAVRAHLARHDEEVAAWQARRGRPGPAWTASVAKAHATPHRPDVARYYASKGAGLD
jgi:nitroreductase